MKFNQWTLALAAAGVVSLGSVAQAEEAQHQVLTALSSTTLSGYVDTSAIWKFGTGNANMPGRSYDGGINSGQNKQDGFNLNVVKLSLAKPLDEAQWSAGYQADLLFGPDANSLQAFGGSGISPGSAPTDLAVQQAYAALRAPVGNGLDFKMGVFESVIGYESFDSYKNPNYSRSYGYAIEPKQHTGVLASYQLAEWLNVAGGVANTAVSTINGRPTRPFPVNFAAESEKTYMGLISLTAPESMGFLKGATLYGGIVDGIDNRQNTTDATSYYGGLTVPTPLEGLAAGASYDYRGTTQKGAVDSSYANATAVYLSYQATEKLKLNNRAEYATGTSGTWTSFPAAKPAGGEEFFGDTFTIDYSLWANVVTRAEFRWDHDLTAKRGVTPPFGGTGFGAGRDKNAYSLALNVIYRF